MASTINESPFIGTELKLNIHIEPMGQITMDDYDFSVEVWTSMKRIVTINKSQAIRIDDSNYVIIVDTAELGGGEVKAKVIAHIPDFDFPDTTRTEIVGMDVNIKVLKTI